MSRFEDSDQLDRQQADQVPYCFPLEVHKNILHDN